MKKRNIYPNRSQELMSLTQKLDRVLLENPRSDHAFFGTHSVSDLPVMNEVENHYNLSSKY